MSKRKREPREHVDDDKIIIPPSISSTQWTSWEDLRYPPGRKKPDISHIPETMGIYELAVWKCESRKWCKKVVYLGSSKDLNRRLKEYQVNGSHKDKKINKILYHGMTLQARYLEPGQSRAQLTNHNYIQFGGEPARLYKHQKAENALLEIYNYAWNDRRNYRIRLIKFPDLTDDKNKKYKLI